MRLKQAWWFGACAALAVAQACGSSDKQTAVRGSGGDAEGGESGNTATGGKNQGGKNQGGSVSGGKNSGGNNPQGDNGGAPSAGESPGGTGNALPQGGAALGGASEAGAGAAGAGGETTCELGEVSSAGTNQNLNLFGTVVYFQDGAALPAGHYRITFVDGCMKYASDQDWTIHAYAGAEPDGWWFVGDTTAQKIVVPPGTIGYAVANGAYATFDECVAANLALAPTEFDFAGGKLGVWLQDNNYGDNLAGVDDRNPKWKLTLLGACVP